MLLSVPTKEFQTLTNSAKDLGSRGSWGGAHWKDVIGFGGVPSLVLINHVPLNSTSSWTRGLGMILQRLLQRFILWAGVIGQVGERWWIGRTCWTESELVSFFYPYKDGNWFPLCLWTQVLQTASNVCDCTNSRCLTQSIASRDVIHPRVFSWPESQTALTLQVMGN